MKKYVGPQLLKTPALLRFVYKGTYEPTSPGAPKRAFDEPENMIITITTVKIKVVVHNTISR